MKLKLNFWNWKCQCKKKMYVNVFHLALTYSAIVSSGWYNFKEHVCSVPIMEWYLIVFYTEFTGGSKNRCLYIYKTIFQSLLHYWAYKAAAYK